MRVLEPSEGHLPELPRPTLRDLYPELLAEARKETTRKARIWDVGDFAKWLNVDPAQACAMLVADGKGRAKSILSEYQSDQVKRKLSSAMINRRISTLRKVIELANDLELIGWTVKIKNLEDAPLRDTRGPGHAGWVRVRDQATKAASRKDVGIRDLVILRLLHDHALRCNEVLSLDVEHWDSEAGRLQVARKGKGSRVPITINDETIIAIAHWLKIRGDAPGPLFPRMDAARPKEGFHRITAGAARALVKKLGGKAGLLRAVKPHGLRHEAITRILEIEHGDIEKARKFGGHANINTTARYNDNRDDVAGEMARKLGKDV